MSDDDIRPEPACAQFDCGSREPLSVQNGGFGASQIGVGFLRRTLFPPVSHYPITSGFHVESLTRRETRVCCAKDHVPPYGREMPGDSAELGGVVFVDEKDRVAIFRQFGRPLVSGSISGPTS